MIIQVVLKDLEGLAIAQFLKRAVSLCVSFILRTKIQ